MGSHTSTTAHTHPLCEPQHACPPSAPAASPSKLQRRKARELERDRKMMEREKARPPSSPPLPIGDSGSLSRTRSHSSTAASHSLRSLHSLTVTPVTSPTSQTAQAVGSPPMGRRPRQVFFDRYRDTDSDS